MKVITKKQANNLIVESLFTKGKTLSIDTMPFCTGKYNKSIIGADVVDLPNIKHVFAEYKNGYYQLKNLI